MAQQRRQFREDAARWIASVALAALVASAATSAVFLAVRRQPAPPPTVAQLAADDERQFAALAPLLEAAAREELLKGTIAPASGPKQVDVAVATQAADSQERIARVSQASNMLTTTPPRFWRLDVTSQQDVRRFVRVADIRRSDSLRQPGYLGVVEIEVDRLTRRATRTGPLPIDPPEGFEVITVAKYNELNGSRQYERQFSTAPDEILFAGRYEDWQPVVPAPADLPAPAGEHYHATLAACNAAEPARETRRETLIFYYDPQAGTWTPQPRGEPTTSASR